MIGRRYRDRENMERMELLYKKFYVKLYLYAQTFLGDEDEAKDIVSGVFQRVWEDWNNGDGKHITEPGSSFLYTAVRNRCLDKIRHNRASDNYAQMVNGSGRLENDEEVADFEQRIEKVHEAVKQLPEPGQTVLRCVYFLKLSYRQTAEKLGMSENMVHKHMVRMFRMLREMLK